MEQNPGSLIVEAPGRVTGIDYRFTPNDTSALGESVFSGLRVTVTQIHPYTPVVGLVIDDQASLSMLMELHTEHMSKTYEKKY